MLIVIVIIGILAAALVPRLRDVQGRARDTKRKTDMKTIYNAMELYKLDNGVYLRPGNAASWSCAYNAWCSSYSHQWQPRISGLSTILTSLPIDPINTLDPASTVIHPIVTGNYNYRYGNVFDGTSGGVVDFDLTAHLENPKDPDRCELKLYTYFGNEYRQYCGGGGNFPYAWWVYEYSPNSNSF